MVNILSIVWNFHRGKHAEESAADFEMLQRLADRISGSPKKSGRY